MNDPVNHPEHYTNHPSGVECITITRHMDFCLGNAFKYVFRAPYKGRAEEDYNKALWYLIEATRHDIKRIDPDASFIEAMFKIAGPTPRSVIPNTMALRYIAMTAVVGGGTNCYISLAIQWVTAARDEYLLTSKQENNHGR